MGCAGWPSCVRYRGCGGLRFGDFPQDGDVERELAVEERQPLARRWLQGLFVRFGRIFEELSRS
jgi:hypothetical protein